MFVCKFARWYSTGNNFFRMQESDEDTVEKTQRMRAKITYRILSDLPRSWTLEDIEK